MDLGAFEHLNWLEPWTWTGPGLEEELVREVGPGHPLYQVRAVAVGRRLDNDDVLFFLPDRSPSLVVVHLTWRRREDDPAVWPSAIFYASADEWAEQCMRPDHEAIG